MHFDYFIHERKLFMRSMMERVFNIGFNTVPNRTPFVKALGMNKTLLARIEKNPESITIENLFKIMQSFGWLEEFSGLYINYLDDLMNDTMSPNAISSNSYLNVNHYMKVFALHIDDSDNVFNFPKTSVLDDSEIEKAKAQDYASYVTSYEGAVNRREIVYKLMLKIREVESKYDLTHELVYEYLPVEVSPERKKVSRITMVRLYRPSGQGLEDINPTIPKSAHSQLGAPADLLLALMQIVPALALGQKIDLRYKLNARR